MSLAGFGHQKNTTSHCDSAASLSIALLPTPSISYIEWIGSENEFATTLGKLPHTHPMIENQCMKSCSLIPSSSCYHHLHLGAFICNQQDHFSLQECIITQGNKRIRKYGTPRHAFSRSFHALCFPRTRERTAGKSQTSKHYHYYCSNQYFRLRTFLPSVFFPSDNDLNWTFACQSKRCDTNV